MKIINLLRIWIKGRKALRRYDPKQMREMIEFLDRSEIVTDGKGRAYHGDTMVATLTINNHDSVRVMYQGRLVLECVGKVCLRYLPGPWEKDISVMKKEYVKTVREGRELRYQLRLTEFGLKGEPYEQ